MIPAVLDAVSQDLRFALRTLRKAPGFVAVSVLSLGVALTTVTLMLAIVQAADFRRLPFRDADALVTMGRVTARSDCDKCITGAHGPLFLEWRARTRHAFSQIEGAQWRPRELRMGDEREQLRAEAATVGLLPMLGVAPVVGRGFADADTVAGAQPVALLTYSVWERRFGGDTAIIGKTIRLVDSNRQPRRGAEPFVVVGVLPDWFRYEGSEMLFTPLDLRDDMATTGGRIDLFARLRPGITVDRAAAEFRALDRNIRADRRPGPDEAGTVQLLKQSWMGMIRPAQERFALFGVAIVVLLLAALNVAALTLTRAHGRRAELAVRGALGASRARLLVQLSVETACIALGGGALAVIAGSFAIRAFSTHEGLGQLGIPATINLPLIAIVLVLVVAICFVVGVLASGQLRHVDLSAMLRSGGALGASRARTTLRRVLTAGQIALALVVVVAAGLLGKELARIVTTEVGYDPHDVVSILVRSPGAGTGFTDPGLARRFADDAISRFKAVPGVVDAGVGTVFEGALVKAEGGDDIPGIQHPFVEDVSPNVFALLHVPLLSGRALSGEDRAGTTLVVVVNHAAASRLWPGESAVGRRVVLGPPGAEETATVVGVVGDFRIDAVYDRAQWLEFFRPVAQGHPPGMLVYVKTRNSSAATWSALRRATAELRGDVAGLSEIRSLEESVGRGISTPRFNTIALGGLALFSLFLATLGIYGVVAATIAARTREIGIRVALGATPRAVLGHVSRQAMGVVAAGTLTGLCGALAATRMLRSMLFGTSPTDPVVFAAATVALVLAAMVAVYVPARRATTLDPVMALRAE